jgi:flavin-dependent dehydrogenase
MIIGAGPAGISTWLHLQKDIPLMAESSIVIEKALFPRDKLCGGGLCPWAYEVLANLKVELDIPSLYVSDLEFRFGKEIDRLHQPNYFQFVQRLDFDHALAKTAVDRGLQLHEEEILFDVVRTHTKLTVKTNKGNYAVKVLIGADGALSLVRRKMFPLLKRHLAPTFQLITPADSNYDHEFDERKTVVDLTPINEGLQGYVWHVPTLQDKTPAIAHGIVDFRIWPDQPKADMKKIFGRELKSRNIHQGHKTWSTHPIPWSAEDDVLSQPNVILAGDAAGIEPAFGGGIHLSLAYGEVAAEAIINAFRTDDFSFHDYTQRIRSHQVGQHISRCTRLARKMYSGSLNPLEAAHEIFTPQYDSSALSREIMSRYLKLHPELSSDLK